jgi:hypothetical protein
MVQQSSLRQQFYPLDQKGTERGRLIYKNVMQFNLHEGLHRGEKYDRGKKLLAH